MESKIVDPLQITFEVSVAADKRSRDLLHNPGSGLRRNECRR
jgi:hypothetical protein